MKTILEILERNVRMYRDHVAISESSRDITYGELDTLSNGYLQLLIEQGVQANEVVAIELERSIEAIAAMLAILKQGAAYTVVNKDYPDSRKQHMRDVLQIKVTIDEILEINHGLEQPWSYSPRSPEQLCYVIFTSGTTSLPKAVGIPDRGVLRLLGEPRFGLSPGKTISHISPLEFDASIIEIWGGLLSGMQIALLSKTEVLNIYHVEKRIQQGIDMMWITSSLFNFWVDKKPAMFERLSHVIVGGEQLSQSHVREVLQYTTVVNGYGPTENTVFTTLDVMTNDVNEIAIGTPIYGTEVYVVDDQGHASSEGELYTSGLGLALGYLGSPEKTKESFTEWNGIEVYKTGDLVRLNDEGKIIYLGRKDTQVKINGYRVDLQEIEYAAKSLGVQNCHAFVQDKRIYLAVTSNTDQLSQNLKKCLPIYMIPSKISYVNELPLTANGKMDTKALYNQHFITKHKKITNIIEKYVASNKLNEHTNIFEFGIDSVIVWEIARDINEQFNADLSFFDIIDNPTIHQISKMLGEEYHAAFNL